MYHDYFGLNEPAFSIAVNPKYLYMSSQHKEALAHLVYGVQGGGFVLLSGEVGTGKTTIVRCLLEQMPGDTEIAFVLNPMSDVDALLATICEELKIKIYADVDYTTKDVMDRIQRHLLENHAKGKRTVLLIDEAQLLSADVLEQIRLLTNLETSTEKLLQIVLVGQPEVNELLAQPRLRQLSQRITARFHLEALSLTETKLYIEHRLKIAGKKDGRTLFPDNMIKKIHRYSGGVPRLINILCERLLVGAYGHNRFEIDNTIFKRALSEVEGAKSKTEKSFPTQQTYLVGSVILTITLIISLSVLIFSSKTNTQSPLAASATESQLSRLSDDGVDPFLSSPNNSNQNNSNSEPHIFSGTSAFASIFSYYGVRVNNESHPCWQTELHQLSCSKTNIETWQELEEINRPVILSLVGSDRNLRFSVLVGLNQYDAFVLDRSGRVNAIPKSQLGEAWNGKIVYLWRKPNGYEKPIGVGTSSPVVEWVAEQFALLDDQSKPITQTRFTQRLQTRIKIFQSSVGLEQDGILGERTIMKLNEKLGLGITLINELP